MRDDGSASSSSRAPATSATRCWPASGSARRGWSGTTTPTSATSTRSSIPGGFSYGDYLRAGAIARFAPAMEAVARVRRRRRSGARDLQRLPGPLRGGAAARAPCCRTRACASSAARSSSRSSAPRPRATRGLRAGRAALDPGQAHERPLVRAAGAARPSSRPTGGSCFATRAGQNPNGSSRDVAGVANEARQRGRPDAAPRARGRPAHRLGRRPGAVRVARRVRARAGAGVSPLGSGAGRPQAHAAGAVRRRRRALGHDAAAADARRPSRARDPARDPLRARADRAAGAGAGAERLVDEIIGGPRLGRLRPRRRRAARRVAALERADAARCCAPSTASTPRRRASRAGATRRPVYVTPDADDRRRAARGALRPPDPRRARRRALAARGAGWAPASRSADDRRALAAADRERARRRRDGCAAATSSSATRTWSPTPSRRCGGSAS